MRLGALLLAVTVASPASAAEDPRVAVLVKQLGTSKDVRVRAQTVLLLGHTGSEAAVRPLCTTLADPEPLVRSAAANALGELRLPAAAACLMARLDEPDATVRIELERARGLSPVPPGALYVSLHPVDDRAGLDGAVVVLADRLLREQLQRFEAVVAPLGEDGRSAAALVKARKLRAFELRLQLLPGGSERGLKVELLVMTYPDQSLKGAWSVRASGGKPESLVKAMLRRVLDDAAADLDWKP